SVRTLATHGQLVFSGSYDCTVRVWNAVTGECLHSLVGHTEKIYSIALDHDRHRVFSGSMDCNIRMWDWDTGELLHTLTGHQNLVGLLSLHHGSLISAGIDSMLRVWDPETGEHRQTLQLAPVTITCFQHDGTKLVSGSDNAKLWDHRTGKFMRDICGQNVSGVWQVAFTDDKLLLALRRESGESYFEIRDYSAVSPDVGASDSMMMMMMLK
ncbi:SCF ubiquitin ligase complex subunit cdc4, partial [Spiromyces aspiralis]